MNFQKSFKRFEIKYLISDSQFEKLKELFKPYMTHDKFANSLIRNIYYDTDDFLLVRRSIEKPCYKEKLRLRVYNGDFDNAFLELKKKFDGIVYKRRICQSLLKSLSIVKGDTPFPNTQIGSEIKFAFNRYVVSPKVMLFYEREAFCATDDSGLRITFDKNIVFRDYDFDITNSVYGEPISDDGKYLMEIKTPRAIPKWLVDFLSENKIYKRSFSKYGNAYLKILNRKEKGEKIGA